MANERFCPLGKEQLRYMYMKCAVLFFLSMAALIIEKFGTLDEASR